jgi:transposase InsO family protein
VAEKVQSALSCSGRAVSRWLGFHRSTLRYQARPVAEKKRMLEMEIVRMSKLHPTLGYKKIAGKLRQAGFKLGKKMVQRVRCEEGLQVPPPKPKTRRRGLSTGLPQKAQRRNHVWAWDFVSDYTQRGGKLRAFNLIDEYTRECHCIHADRAIRAADVLGLLQDAIEEHGPPEYIRSDNGPEFIAKIIQKWLKENGIKTIYIDPGCPWQNGYAESFNSRFRMECLDRELLHTLSESRVVFTDWRDYYNHERPHRSLGLLTPKEFAKKITRQGPDSGRPTGSLRRGLSHTENNNQPAEIIS